jgi:hypothetical protein
VLLHKGSLARVMYPSELEGSDVRTLTVKLARMEPGAITILEGFGRVELSANVATVKGQNIDPSKLNAALIHAGFSVQSLTAEETELETAVLELGEETN